jgi:hypothetical protein
MMTEIYLQYHNHNCHKVALKFGAGLKILTFRLQRKPAARVRFCICDETSVQMGNTPDTDQDLHYPFGFTDQERNLAV